MRFANTMPAAFQTPWYAHPAGQAQAPIPTVGLVPPQPTPPAPPASCPAAPHCPSLPSGDSAYQLITTGSPTAALKVGRDMVLRGVLIWSGMKAYSVVTKHKEEKLLQLAVAGAAGIELFVILWTWANKPAT